MFVRQICKCIREIKFNFTIRDKEHKKIYKHKAQPVNFQNIQIKLSQRFEPVARIARAQVVIVVIVVVVVGGVAFVALLDNDARHVVVVVCCCCCEFYFQRTTTNSIYRNLIENTFVDANIGALVAQRLS